MPKSDNETGLDEVMVPTETVNPDHREHAKSPKHLDDDALNERAEHEQQLVDDAQDKN
ncbi:hypothetical protein DFR67_106174 [Williamsia limnetica]|jgi:hypothetical protein|uniref:YfhD family protein n=1 Tax=Williamsia limnetica TaxID=882452 RepID=A0A318RIU6_WILLI|nr:hypothetical protein [Williamsia limnetica]PYE17471.1 hypothetical protein DFR67_106174 [Williamsia limnetica]